MGFQETRCIAEDVERVGRACDGFLVIGSIAGGVGERGFESCEDRLGGCYEVVERFEVCGGVGGCHGFDWVAMLLFECGMRQF